MDFELTDIFAPAGVLVRARLYAPDGSTVTDLALAEGAAGVYAGSVAIAPPPPYSADPYEYAVRQVTAQTAGAFTASATELITRGTYAYSAGGEWSDSDPEAIDVGAPDERRERLIVATPAAGRVATWSELKAHLRLSDDEDETYCLTLLDAASDYAEAAMGCSLIARTLVATFYDAEPLELPAGPLLQVYSVEDRDEATIAGYTVKHTGKRARVELTGAAAAAAAYPITVTYRAGHANAAAVPASIRLAVMAHVGTLYENRESVSEKQRVPVPHQLEAFYRLKSRRVSIG